MLCAGEAAPKGAEGGLVAAGLAPAGLADGAFKTASLMLKFVVKNCSKSPRAVV